VPRRVGMVNREPRLRIRSASLRRCIRSLDAFEGFQVPAGALEVAFVDAAECRRLHAEFFGDDDLTDVMTFPGDPAEKHAGDIAICPAAAFDACRESGLPFAAELTLYLVHAWLHLAGLDDGDPAGRAGMRRAEQRLMDHLGAVPALLEAGWTG